METRREGFFEGAGGLKLLYRAWGPPGISRAVLAVVHGHGEHSGRYEDVADTLVPRGVAVVAFDLRGHGRSPGQRGHIESWDDYREDVRAFLHTIHAEQPGAPVFLWGYSLGALIALEFALRSPRDLHGLILMGTPIRPAGVARPYLVWLARVFGALIPRFRMNLGLDVGRATRDPAVVEAGRHDPLMHPWASARWGSECLRALAWVQVHASDLRLPVLFLHGEADAVSAVEGVRAYFARLTCPDRELKIYPGASHELHHDLVRDQVLADMGDWMLRHTG